MPDPVWAQSEDLWSESPQRDMEILGIGSQSRKSKSYTESLRQSYILSRMRGHYRMLCEILRVTHAHHHRRPRYEENADGDMAQVGEEPEVLSDEELCQRYSGLRTWRDAHQEVVDHNPSFKGFSIKATTHLPEEDDGKRRESSSAGSRHDVPNERW